MWMIVDVCCEDEKKKRVVNKTRKNGSNKRGDKDKEAIAFGAMKEKKTGGFVPKRGDIILTPV